MTSSGGILLRYGEVFLKKGRRRFFLDCLAANLPRAFTRGPPHLNITRPYGRFLVLPRESGARIENAMHVAESLAAVFGIVSAEPCEIVENATPESLAEATATYAKSHRKRQHKTFKVNTRRAFKRFPRTSIDCNREFGSAVFLALGDIEVDLHNPDLTIHVEIRENLAMIYGAGVPGVGGLPVTSNGRALLLLSGGIDSPVAGWLTQKRGVAVDCVTFMSPPYTGPKAQEKTVTLARLLARQQKSLTHWTIPLTPLQERYRDNAPPEQLVLLYRRSMVRIASAIADSHSHQALVTGESLGQVASQTLPNLHCIEQVASMPIIRPLITYDKHETIGLAEKIGSYQTSIEPYDDCCSLFVPKHPELKGKPSLLEKIESHIDPFELESALLESATQELIK